MNLSVNRGGFSKVRAGGEKIGTEQNRVKGREALGENANEPSLT